MKKTLTLLTCLFSVPAFAQQATVTDLINKIPVLSIVTGVVLVVLLFVLFMLFKVLNMLKREALGVMYVEETVDERTYWERLLSLKPLAAEKDIELEHDYDGIKELNNPIPPWFNVLFYSTIAIAVIYLLVFHVFEIAPLQAKEYENQLAEAQTQKEEYVMKAGNLVDESNVTQLTDAAMIDEGKQIYVAKCVVCHGEKGEGKVGPNLSDVYWLHGGDMVSIFKTIKYGVPSKGMVSWQNSMNGKQMQQLASFILTLQGTNPPGAKEAQGEMMQVEVKEDSVRVDSASK